MLPSTSRAGQRRSHGFEGIVGRRATVTTNYYGMENFGNVKLYIYEMRFFTNGSQRLKRTLCRQLFWEAVDRHPRIFTNRKFVFDDVSRLYSLFPLKDFLGTLIAETPLKFNFPFRDGARAEETAHVELSKVDELVVREPYTAPMVQFLNTLVTQAARTWRTELSRRCYAETNRIYVLPTNKTRFDLGNCTQLIHGISASVRIDANGLPKLNVDLVNSSFLRMEMELIEYYAELICKKPLTATQLLQLHDYSMSSEQARRMDAALAGARLKTKHQPIRYYRYAHLIPEHAHNCFFEDKHGKISVDEYFYRRYNERLRFPFMPLVKLQSSGEYDICMPMEMLAVAEAPQRIRKLLPADVLRKVVQRTSFPPAQHFQHIQDLVGTIQLTGNSFLDAFGVGFASDEFLKINDARVLPRLTTFFNKDSVRQGNLRMFRKPSKNNILFAVICLDLPETAVNSHIEAAINVLAWKCAENLRFHYPDNPYEFFDDYYFKSTTFRPYMENVRAKIASVSAAINPLFIFLCEPNYENYDEIKTVCEVEMGLISQFINYPRLERIRARDNSVINNIMLKINLKLGGVNNAILSQNPIWLKFMNAHAPTMFFGITAIHPQKGEDFPSVAALSYTLDFGCTMFCGEFLSEFLSFERGKGFGGGNQRVCDITSLILKAISDFSHENGTMPKHLFFLREGLSGQQIEDVSQIEYAQIGEACRQFSQKYEIPFRPTITYVVVQKRHGTRFHMDRGQYESLTDDSRSANGNVPSGTVVDTVITGAQKINNPNDFEKDFYLCSQKGLLGTSRPAHYTVYLDEWELSADEMECCNWVLCHLIGRSFATVSVPAPIHYSNLLAARARRYLYVKSREIEGTNDGGVKVHDALDRQLYFT